MHFAFAEKNSINIRNYCGDYSMYILRTRKLAHCTWRKDVLLTPLAAVTFQQGHVLGV